ncbi:hypothetical protein FQJ51_22935 [Escherichia coli]|nr:hypothetical protein [Escherichia coli]EFN5058434.1 hypothetical protein [Escherichia coli]EFN5073005.1 hypothetical protein [Escherichia coli]
MSPTPDDNFLDNPLFSQNRFTRGSFYCLKANFISVDTITLKVHHYFINHPAPQNAGQYLELPGSGKGLSSQPEAYEHDGGRTLNSIAVGF